ncbi:MAG: sigma-54 dependent transcriptional regulator [Planctomycetota bacterium]
MSASDDGARLRERLAALLAEARALGCADELRPALARFLAVPGADGAEAGAAIPARFGLVGESPAMRAVFAVIERAAPAEVSVLIHGETGTGKELVARALHAGSPRCERVFLAENCAAIPPGLLESELFGHVKGAFTHAVAARDGHFVAADGGTLFLDEIADMPLEMQGKLLRVLERGEVRAVGGEETRPVDVRVLAATHGDLPALVAAGRFRADLYWRLDVIRIDLPPLREREGDVVLLARHFLQMAQEELRRPDVELTPEALEALAAAPWPGNVRQLENEIRRAVALSGGKIRRSDLSPEVRGEV